MYSYITENRSNYGITANDIHSTQNHQSKQNCVYPLCRVKYPILLRVDRIESSSEEPGAGPDALSSYNLSQKCLSLVGLIADETV